MPRVRILILRGGAIGDFIFTLPALQAIRNAWPESYIELTGYPHIASLARAGGLVDTVSSLDSVEIARYFSLKPSIPDAQARHSKSFDLIITYLFDPDETVKRNLLTLGAKQVIYGNPVVKGGHAVDVLMKPLEVLAIFPEGAETPRLKLDTSVTAIGKTMARKFGESIIAIHPGSGSPKKNWPLEKYMELAERIAAQTGCKPVFILGEADGAIAAAMRPEQATLAGHSLVDLAGFLSACTGYAGNDTGITHLAAAIGIPAVAIYGPTDPATWAPRGPNARIVATPTRADDALSLITVDQVFDALSPRRGLNT